MKEWLKRIILILPAISFFGLLFILLGGSMVQGHFPECKGWFDLNTSSCPYPEIEEQGFSCTINNQSFYTENPDKCLDIYYGYSQEKDK